MAVILHPRDNICIIVSFHFTLYSLMCLVLTLEECDIDSSTDYLRDHFLWYSKTLLQVVDSCNS